MSTTTATTLAVQNKSFICTFILRDQHRLAQVREDALTQARINVLRTESKQKLSLEKELYEERRKAITKEIEIRVKKAEMEKKMKEQFLKEMIVQLKLSEDLKRDLIKKESVIRIGR